MQSFDALLKNAGLKITVPRKKVLEVLVTNIPHHLPAETIHASLKAQKEDIALATVYRVLSQLTEADLIIRHRFADDVSVYEFKSDEHHDHLICTECDKVEEFCHDVIENAIQNGAKKAGFLETSHQLTIYGICSDCKSKQR